MGAASVLHERNEEGERSVRRGLSGMTGTGEGAYKGNLQVDDPATRLSGVGFSASEIP